MTTEELARKIHEADCQNDLEALDQLEQYFEVSDRRGPGPFAPEVRLQGISDSQEGDVALALFNSWSRKRRRARFRIKKGSVNYSGPIIVSEGDSWFQFPVLLDDIIDVLTEDLAILSLGAAGDHLADMVIQNEYTEAIRENNAHYFLISGGGNDLLGGGNLWNYLLTYEDGMADPEDMIATEQFDRFLAKIKQFYVRIVEDLVTQFPALKIIGHGYDRPLPREKGPWIGPSLASRGIPKRHWNDVIGLVIDRFNDMLGEVQAQFPQKFFYIDCRGEVGAQPNSWHDEIHPKDPGYRRCAKKFLALIKELELVRPRNGWFSEMARQPVARIIRPHSSMKPTEAIVAGLSRAVMSARPVHPLDPVPGNDALVAWQRRFDEVDRIAYQHYTEVMRELDQPDTDERLENREEMLPRSDIFSLERIIGDSNLFQVNYLYKGSRAARAVGRITVVNSYGISRGFGSGFLVAPGLLMTNNHVLKDRSLVRNSYLVMNYEYDDESGLKQTVKFRFTDEVFVTNQALDFTIVSVESTGQEGKPLAEFGFLRLIKESGKAVKKEPMSIIQHANGLPKQIAIRDSIVLGRKSDFIYYTTDTNSGSSGSPVLNDQWLPVALHHRAVPDFNKVDSYVCNRGIRISSIVEYLEEISASNGEARECLRLILPSDRFDDLAGGIFDTEVGGPATEALKEPFHEVDYGNRRGYDRDYLGFHLPLPEVKDKGKAATLKDSDDIELRYEHFSIVMWKPRKLALFTVANASGIREERRPESGRSYSRRGLSGLGENDRERWFCDDRIALSSQLPDIFFSKDQGAFDKGHLVKRDDVTWGHSYAQVRRANGDTYHTTNCSPQVAGFNRSNLSGLWGQLENVISDQMNSERLTILSGPVLDPSDQTFVGTAMNGQKLRVQIPQKYWKVVVAVKDDDPQAFGFLLEQDLSDVPLEFAADGTWKEKMISLSSLEVLVRHFSFPDVLHQADQAGGANGESLRESLGLGLVGGRLPAGSNGRAQV